MTNSTKDLLFMVANLAGVLGGGYVGGLYGQQTLGFFAGAAIVFAVCWPLRRRSEARERSRDKPDGRTEG